jgi:hypothetical protein
MHDIEIKHCGTVGLVRPITIRGFDWAINKVDFEEWQGYGDSIACEPRMLLQIMEGAVADGLRVKETYHWRKQWKN